MEDIGDFSCFMAKICKDGSLFLGSRFRVVCLFAIFLRWREVIVFVGMQNMSDGYGFYLFTLFTDRVSVQPISEESYGTEFVTGGVAGVVRDDVICGCRFSVYCKFEFLWASMDGSVQKIDPIVVLLFDCKVEIIG